MGNGSFPRSRQWFPLGNEPLFTFRTPFPVENAPFPAGNGGSAAGNASSKAGNASFPLGKVLCITSELSLPNQKAPFPLGNGAFPASRASLPGEAAPFPTGNACRRAGKEPFPLGNASLPVQRPWRRALGPTRKASTSAAKPFPERPRLQGLTVRCIAWILCVSATGSKPPEPDKRRTSPAETFPPPLKAPPESSLALAVHAARCRPADSCAPRRSGPFFDNRSTETTRVFATGLRPARFSRKGEARRARRIFLLKHASGAGGGEIGRKYLQALS
jgi:hypothetical protein